MKFLIALLLLVIPVITDARFIMPPLSDNFLPIVIEEPIKEERLEIKDYVREQCMKRVGSSKWWFWCTNMMLTINWESWRRPFVISRTKDYWLFQLHYKYHKAFINSSDYKDVYKQVDYWISVWLDAKKKNRKCNRYAHPWC